MILNNNNKAFMKTLSDSCLKANKMRNRIAVLAIILTAVLFTALATVVQGVQYSMQEQKIRQSGTRFMCNVKNLTLEKAEEMMKNPSFTKVGLTNNFAVVCNEGLDDIRVITGWADDKMAENCYMKPEKGHLPQKENEVACDSEVLKALGLPYKVGSSFTLQYKINERIEETQMVVSGIWKGEEYEANAQMLVSKEFLEKHLKESMGAQTVSEAYCVYGSFSSADGLKEQLDKIISDAGYNPDAERDQEGFVLHHTNSAYESKSVFGAETIASAIAGVLIVLLAGYLIIYNVFRISIMKDIRLYGQLKTIGTSPKQIKFMIRRQGIKLAIIGIPAGLVLGWLLGNGLLPLVMRTMTYTETTFLMPNVFAWIFAAVFTFVTVVISVNKPGKTAGKISPVDALRYQEADDGKKVRKGGMESRHRIMQMAFANLGRNKGKTALVVLSISLSILLLNCVWNFTGSFDEDTYVKRELTRDFDVTSKTFRSNFDDDAGNVLPETFVETIRKEEEVTDLGVVYYRGRLATEDDKSTDFLASIIDINGTKLEANQYDDFMQIYGYDETALKAGKLIEGTLDYEKMETGNYAVACGYLDDKGEFGSAGGNIHAGDKIRVNIQGEEKEIEILAVIGTPAALSMNYSSGGYLALGFSEQTFLQEFPENKAPIHCIFNAKEGSFDKLNAKVQKLSKSMGITAMTKLYAQGQYNQIIITYNGVGSILAGIFGVIGVLNLLNVILTGAIARKGEFATMRSIGMTRKQLRKLFVAEAIFYAAVAGIFGIAISAILSLTVVKGLCQAIWFTKYSFTILPAVGTAAAGILISMGISSLVDRIWNKGSIVENLRKAE